MKLIVSGGGTGGHIYPALAIAKEFMERHPDGKVLYVGKHNGLERELAEKAGFDFAPIHVEGLPRKAINKKTVTTMMALFKGLRECSKIIKDFAPDVVVGTGGYVCAPVLLKAQQQNIPTLVQEQNAYPGKTNRFLARKADVVALCFEEAKKYLPEKAHVIITGNPVRKELFYNEKERDHTSAPYHVLSFGGSGGQESTNEAMIHLLKHQDPKFQITHITGKDHYEGFLENFKEKPWGENVTILPYSYEIPTLLEWSDLVVASSSAMTLAEISAKALPSILIPKAYTAGNHQYFNGKTYQDAGASIMITEEELTGELLFKTITELLEDPGKRLSMGAAAKKLANPHAVELIVTAITNIVETGGKAVESAEK